MKCEMCNREFKNSRTLGIHISTTHINKLNTALENHLNYIAWFNEEQAYDWIEKYKEIIK